MVFSIFVFRAHIYMHFFYKIVVTFSELWWYRRSGIKEGLLWHVQQRLWLLVTAEDSEPVLCFTCRRV
jgi:hypothetical protein